MTDAVQQSRARLPYSRRHVEEIGQLRLELTRIAADLDGLRTAMQTRAAIEQAKGMIMLREGCDADAAFEVLVRLSQKSHRKLNQVAQALVEAWTSTRVGGPRVPADKSPG